MSILTFDQLKNDPGIQAYAQDRSPSFNGLGAALSGVFGKDANSGLGFLVSQFAYTEAGALMRQYEPLQYTKFVPVSNEVPLGAQIVRYQTYDQVGMGRRVSGASTEIHAADVSVSEKSYDIFQGESGYKFTIHELETAAYLRMPLTTAKPAAAVEAWQRHINFVALRGETNAPGLFNHPSIPVAPALTGNWATATPDQKLADLNLALSIPFNASAHNDAPNVLLLPQSKYDQINVPRSTGTDTTILEFFLANNLSKTNGVDLQVMVAYDLQTAGPGGTPCMMAYRKDPQKLVMQLPQNIQFLAPQLSGFDIKIPGKYSYSGVQIRYPKSFVKVTGI